MLQMIIKEKACRGCKLCLEVCPTEVFTFNEQKDKAEVAILENCIACLSCDYICPSAAISLENHHVVANFYRNIHFSRRMEKFL